MTSLLLLKTIALLVLSIVLLEAADSYIGSGSSWPIIPDSEAGCSEEPLTIVADNRSLCWYYQCVVNNIGEYLLFPKRCALGTYVSPTFTKGKHNPCSQRFAILGMYDCTRPRKVEGEVDCKKDLKCKNNETAMQEDNVCWCACPLRWQGAADCSVPKGESPSLLPAADCPFEDWCNKSLNGTNPCQNGGTCVNQCKNFYCACPVPYMKTKFCGEFNCSNTDFTCPNTNENCTRGLNGKDEFYVCRSEKCADYLYHWVIGK